MQPDALVGKTPGSFEIEFKGGRKALFSNPRNIPFEIGDYAALNLGVVVQNHLFEDRIMKSSRLRIGDDCSVGNMSVVLYDTEMRPRSSLGPLSLLMKGETLAPESRSLGIPNSPAR